MKPALIRETLKKDITHNQAEALVEIYERLRPGDLASPDTAKELIENMFELRHKIIHSGNLQIEINKEKAVIYSSNVKQFLNKIKELMKNN